MTRVEISGKWAFRAAIILAVFTPLYFAISALGSRFGLWDWRYGLGMLTRDLGPKLLYITTGVGLISVALALFTKSKRHFLLSLCALLIPLSGLYMGYNFAKTARSLPVIHDITTDTNDPPAFSTEIVKRRGEKSNPLTYAGKTALFSKELVSATQVRAYPDIRTLVFTEAPDEIYPRTLAVAKAMGWDIVTTSEATGMIEATAKTFWFGFKDDVAIRVRAAESGGSNVDVRSISRVGGSDIGVNAGRIRKFRKKLGG